MNKSQRSLDTLLKILPIITLAGFIILFFNRLAFSNLILARGDTFLYFYPYWQTASEAFRAGHVPLWNQHIFMGAPLLANSQAGYFYPLNWVVWSFFAVPYAVSVSIILHLFIAGLGTFAAGRRVMNIGRSGSVAAAIAFALGGYLTAQVEHVNQLQGLSWLPWFLIAVELDRNRTARSSLGSITAIALLFSLQLLAGHTQTTFITGVGLLLWIAARMVERRLVRNKETVEGTALRGHWIRPVIALTAGTLLAVLISAVQLLPTLELAQLSSRQGGLSVKEVLSFSLPPLLLSRTLLPAVGQSLFSEYVAFLPLIFLALAFIGAWQWRRIRGVLPALIWVVFGIYLALGAYNPLNWLLVRMPLFDLFRAPARWMALYALGAALLAGVGWHLFWQWGQYTRSEHDEGDNKILVQRSIIRPLRVFLLLSALLIFWGLISGSFLALLPTGDEAPYEAPSTGTLIIWAVEWFLLAVISLILSAEMTRWRKVWLLGVLAIVGIGVLFIGSRPMPYNNLTTPEAFFDLRPPISRLLAEGRDEPSRFLSLSDIFFDSGDQLEIDTIYQDQLPVSARYDYTIAVKQKEIIAPNLPMIYGLHSVDGFDGGILPLESYSQITELILPEGEMTTDGRLREHLGQVPEGKWLDLFNMQFLITDKVGDVWQNGIFFDRQHAVTLKPGELTSIGFLPDYQATSLQIMASHLPGLVYAETKDGRVWELAPEEIGDGLYEAVFPHPVVLTELKVRGCTSSTVCLIEALTLVDERDESFYSLVPGAYRLIHSGDVKIYENLDVLPRAFIVHDWLAVPDLDASVAAMASSDFDPRYTAVIIEAEDVPSLLEKLELDISQSYVEIEAYSDDRVVLNSFSEQSGLLLLTDSYYPGWKAFLDGREVQIIQADGIFRGVFVPDGVHQLVFELRSQSYNTGRALSLISLAIFVLLVIIQIVWWVKRKMRERYISSTTC